MGESTLDYARKKRPAPPRPPRPWEVRAALGLALLVTLVAGRIEVLNVDAGSYLPRRGEARPGGGFLKWRAPFVRSERAWRTVHLSNDRADWQTRPLSAAEAREMRREVAENVARSSLREWVSGVGLLQYVLAPAAMFWCGSLLLRPVRRRVRIAAAAAVVLAFAAGVLAVYRGYFTSLGW
jgi:hypothetical protein